MTELPTERPTELPTELSNEPSTALDSEPVPVPPDLYGRPRPDRFFRFLEGLADWYFPRFVQPVRRPGPPPAPAPLELTVVSRTPVAEDVVALTLGRAGAELLPRWQGGAHLDVVLPSGRIRSYSLCGDPADRYHYRIAVRRVPEGGGGSVEVHDALLPGATVEVRGPRNAFPFAAEPRVLLLAGGIGLTPLLPMAHEAARRGLDWRLVHTGRTAASLPLADEVAELARRHPGRVEVLTDDSRDTDDSRGTDGTGDADRTGGTDGTGDTGRPGGTGKGNGSPDAADLLARCTPGAAVYCCGPGPMLDAVRAAFPASPAGALHFERFGSPQVIDGAPFTLRLRSGAELSVPADRSALDVLREHAPATPYSCRQGFCGVCRVRVLAGTVDHRDRRLDPGQRAAGDMLVCVSRAPEGARLELDV